MRTFLGLVIALVIAPIPTRLNGQSVTRLALANASTEFEFQRLNSAVELSDGSLVFTDLRDQKIYKTRFDGSAPSTLLRKGSGPGEFQGVGLVYALSGDSILFVDSFHGRWTLLYRDRVVGTISESREFNQKVLGQTLGVSRTGSVLGLRARAWNGPGPRLKDLADTLDLLLGDIRTSTVNAVGQVAGPGTRGYVIQRQASKNVVGMIMAKNPLASADEGVLMPDGWIAVARNAPYRVDFRSPNGTWKRGPILEAAGPKLTREDQCAAIRMVRGTKVACEPESYPGWPTTLPPFGMRWSLMPAPIILGDPQGRVLVSRLGRSGSKTRRYDLVDRSGARIKSIEVEANQQVLAIGQASIYLTEIGEDDLVRITRHPWP